MKKIILMAVLAVLCQGTFLFAQDAAPKFTDESSYYYFNFPIEKIYAHRLGYMVVYRRGANLQARTFIPMEWFNKIGAQGEIIGLSHGTEWPSMTVYYKDGQFSHVRLRLRRERAHESWGLIPLNVNFDEHFAGIEEVKLEF